MAEEIEENFPSRGWGKANLISHQTPRILIGRVLTLIDALGLPEKQESSFKSLVRQEIEKSLYDDSIGIDESIVDKVHIALENLKSHTCSSNPAYWHCVTFDNITNITPITTSTDSDASFGTSSI